MPNHITSRLKITGNATKVAEVFNYIKADVPDKEGNYRLFDLEKIVPMPKALDIDSSSLGEDGMKYLYSMAGNIHDNPEFMITPKFLRNGKRNDTHRSKNRDDFLHRQTHSRASAQPGKSWHQVVGLRTSIGPTSPAYCART